MTTHRYLASLSMLVVTCSWLSANAADRVRAGQWVGTTITAGKTFPSSSCLSKSDADAMNGDSKSIRAYLEKTIPPEICKLADIRANGGQVVYTALCGGAPARVVTTSYHGDRFEGTDDTGTKTEGKLTGPCK